MNPEQIHLDLVKKGIITEIIDTRPGYPAEVWKNLIITNRAYHLKNMEIRQFPRSGREI
jgi:hypothetical protein